MNSRPSVPQLLIVDDDMLLRSMAVKTLRHAGFEVSDVADGEAALLRFQDRVFDLILLDVMLPGFDGYEVCRRIRSMAGGARVPILMLTGRNDTASIELAYSHGATDFITKPINWALLSHKVRYALRAGTAIEDLVRSRESLARAQNLAGMGNWTLRPDGRMECSAELLRLFDAPAGMHACNCAADFLARVVPCDRERVARARARLTQDGQPYQMEFQIARFDGTERTVFEQAASVQDDHGRTVGIEGITQDISERVRSQARIRELAQYDPVTGLPNRQFFAELTVPMLERARREAAGCAVLHLDINRFKSVNDALGRAHGDAVLKIVGERLRSCLRRSDLVSVRHASGDLGIVGSAGGDFTLLIDDIGAQQQATLVAQRLLQAIAAPLEIAGQRLVLSASVGIAMFPNDGEELFRLAQCAEQAVHAAKEAGRVPHRFFDEQLNVHAATRLLLEDELRKAIEQGELLLHFQPKVNARTRAIVGAEALMRWQHPVRGLLPPAAFIPLAEETRLILPLTDWALESACQHLRGWADAGLPSVPVSVNLAALSLSDAGLLAKLDALMQRYALEPASLILEMTETMLMRDVEAGMALMNLLRQRGYRLSLDDFGTGYSSLNYLKRFPLDELKIDRAFVTDAARGKREGALAAAIIALGGDLGLSVVAEGVESAEQSTFLLARGCSVQQGYLFSKPLPAEQFAQQLRVGSIPLSQGRAA